jgi:hypothetical protein
MSSSSVTPIPKFLGFENIYRRLAPLLWDRGLNPLPVKEGIKKPSIKWGPLQSKRMAKRTMDRFVERFGDANQVAIPTGSVHGITVVDIDGDASDIDFAIDTFGYPRVMVETPSFGVHLYYRHKGERNRTRIFDRAIDIRGAGGLIIVPGCVRDMEPYRFLEGGWDDLHDLTEAYPTLQEVEHGNRIRSYHTEAGCQKGTGTTRCSIKAETTFISSCRKSLMASRPMKSKLAWRKREGLSPTTSSDGTPCNACPRWGKNMFVRKPHTCGRKE